MANKDADLEKKNETGPEKNKIKEEKTIKIEEVKEISEKNKEKEITDDASAIIEIGTKKDQTIREKTKIFFDDLRIRFKNLFSPEKKIKYLPEYYDLPYRYNKDTVRILAQTPNKLFVYWDFDDRMKKEITEKYGEYFWEKTYPVLVVKNLSKNYSFEIKIDDFANSWYIDIPDNSSVYSVEIGRKLKENFEYSPKIEFEIQKKRYVDKHLQLDKENLTRELLEQRFIDENRDFNFYGPTITFAKDDYIHFGSSNNIVSPNGHILFDSLRSRITFRNIVTGTEYDVELKKKLVMSEVYEDIEKDLYQDEKSRSSWLTSSGLAFERNI